MSKVTEAADDTNLFGENFLRLQIVCNSLQAMVREGHAGTDTKAEVRSLARFFRDELPDLLAQNEAIMGAAVTGSGSADFGSAAVLAIMREDTERLNSLARRVIETLEASVTGRCTAREDELRSAVSAYVAAQRSHLDWSRKLVFGVQVRPCV